MANSQKVYQMRFARVYPLLVAKAERKGRTRAEVDAATSWLTGYEANQIVELAASNITYGDFFRDAPRPNPKRGLVTGVVCGVRVEDVEEPLMRDIRRLDKLVDELSRGKPLEKVLRS